MERKACIVDAEDMPLVEGMLVSLMNGEAIFEADRVKDAEKLEDGEYVHLKITDSSNGIKLYIGLVKSRGKKRIHIGNLKEEQIIQRRMDVKAYMEFNCEIQDKNCPENWYKVQVKDISAGGIRIYTDVLLDRDTEYEIILPVTKYPLVVGFKIVRVENGPGNNGFMYGCRFQNLRMGEENMIRQAVFRVLAEARKREKEKKEMEIEKKLHD